MNKTLSLQKLLFPLTIFALVNLSACKKDDYSLPPETQTGAGTFGCKINGKVWVPRGSDGYSGGNTVANYQFIYPSPIGYHFQLSAANYEKDPLEAFGIGADSLTIEEGKTYDIKNGIKSMFGASYRISASDINKLYYVKDTLRGEVHFTRFDQSALIASGTFWFDAKNLNGEIIHVTEGRFDVKFTR